MKKSKANTLESQKTVTTITGRVELQSDCKFIDGGYYKIGDVSIEHSGDCYYLDASNKYVRLTSDLLIFDHNVKRYVYKNNKSFQKGVVSISETGELIMGHFSYKRLYLLPVLYNAGQKHYCINEGILLNQRFYKEDLSNGVFYNKNAKKARCFTKKAFCSYDEKKKLSYSVDSDLIKTNKASHKEGFDYPISQSVDILGNFIGDFTFGLEFETSKGYVPSRICRKLGLIPLRDGSIEGLEFVTIPLQGKTGLQTVVETAKQLDARTETNSNCSLHLHIGNIPRTEKFFLAMYKLLFLVQDEIFNLFPTYKKDNRGLKKKHYTKPFDFKDVMYDMDKVITDKNITENFSYLFKYLSMGKSYSNYDNSLLNVNSHPSDPQGTSKWQIRSRYHWVNLVPLLFGNKQTIEFRIHTATHDYGKVMMYMAICMNIVRYAIDKQDYILKNDASLKNVDLRSMFITNGMNSNLTSMVYDYCNDRKYFINNQLKNGVVMPKENDLHSSSSDMLKTYNNKKSYYNNKPFTYGNLQQAIYEDVGVEPNNTINII
mgnify:CR=1 FL=1